MCYFHLNATLDKVRIVIMRYSYLNATLYTGRINKIAKCLVLSFGQLKVSHTPNLIVPDSQIVHIAYSVKLAHAIQYNSF